jgi:hypothetical protein
VLSGGTLWHLHKFLQYIILEFTPFTTLLYPPSPTLFYFWFLKSSYLCLWVVSCKDGRLSGNLHSFPHSWSCNKPQHESTEVECEPDGFGLAVSNRKEKKAGVGQDHPFLTCVGPGSLDVGSRPSQSPQV